MAQKLEMKHEYTGGTAVVVTPGEDANAAYVRVDIVDPSLHGLFYFSEDEGLELHHFLEEWLTARGRLDPSRKN